MRDAAVRMAAAGRAARENARERRAQAERSEGLLAHLSLVRAPSRPMGSAAMSQEFTVATYNVHRWTGLNGRKAPDPARAGFVISELDADVIALQEVLRPSVSSHGGEGIDIGDDPLVDLSEALGMHLVFAVTREHRRGQLGNAILSRFPVSATSVVDISFSRIERRGALTAQFNGELGSLGVVATHLSLVDRTRHRQVQSLLDHPQVNAGPVVLMGDMNAWRRCPATRELDESLRAHHNLDWPPSFPSAAPVLALDRIYARGARVIDVSAHDTPAARRASDHLPVVARIELESD
ncbi:MAG: endonuclease/exonuclease/phosphatase family protein [Myxococcota bacterium]